MTDKDIKDYCKNCDVEPPAMKFKCPECEHNPDKENFAKDINVPRKEQIMIDGVDVRNCKGIDLSLSPLVKCKSLKFKTSDGGIAGIWCSDHTNCCFKQLARKTQECEQKDKELKELKRQYKLSCLDCEYKNTKADVERYRKECNFWKHQAELGSETTDRLAKQLEEKEQECEELKDKLAVTQFNLEQKCKVLKDVGVVQDKNGGYQVMGINRYRKALEKIEEYTREQFCENCDDYNTTEYNSHCEYCEYYEYFDIINKAKGEEYKDTDEQ